MRISDDKYLREDLERVAAQEAVDWERLRGKNILITGATGLVGSLVCKCLLKANDVRKLNITVLAVIRNIARAKIVYEDLLDREDLKFIISDISQSLNVEEDVDYIIHCASITNSQQMINMPVETIDIAVKGTRILLNCAKEKNVNSFVYVSSMEVYGTMNEKETEVTEDDLGVVDPLITRSNYPLSKRLCENMCISYYSEFSVPVKIARLAQTFGPGILPGENRVFAQFARSVIDNTDIVLHTKGLSEGNYCYSADTIAALLIIMLNGEDANAYNVSNPKTHTTIADMANVVASNISKGKIKVIYDIPENNVFGYAADTKMKLSSEKLKRLGWNPQTDLEEAFERLIGSMRATSENGLQNKK